ncbi:MAG TPA: bifunctional serine/threonine-protein kinase/formylglycine-generating enzyme family protein [Prosthecobacter sp.]|nr:bifunctional serine/threonine-protein kinase/formylglycine-generating enzyme family protein [Prosthecobacter sp.]
MDDPDVTLPLPRPAPKAAEVTGAEAEALLAAGAGLFDTRPASSSPRGWEPPGVELLQAVLPQYEITALIARGGMGAVYRGTQRALKRPVAIKVLPPEMNDAGGSDLQFAARFKQEAQAMARLSHPNIVAVFDAGEVVLGRALGPPSAAGGEERRTEDSPPHQTLLYFVMEFIKGTDVAQLIASEGPLDAARVVPIIAAVCEALAFAHEEGIVHRDIKPSNIMIDRKGRVKVADFGLAKAVNVESTLMTRSDVAMGTPDFVAPEALIPGMAVDGRADLYAVGVMLYQMLTGKIPRGRFELPSGVVPQVDKGFDAIVDKAMQADREKRYSTALEMKREVEAVAAPAKAWSGDAPVATPDHRLAPAATKGRKPLLLGTAAAVILGTGAFFLMDEPTEAESKAGATTAGASPLTAASKDAPFVNSLGMKFVPVPIIGGPTGGKRVLFSIWETRVKDYEAFAASSKRQWDRSHELPQGAEYPAIDVSWHDAVAFCEWLTAKEQKAGLIGSQARYRLPSDHEWSCAAGNEYEDAAQLPSEKTIKRPIYPWGVAWPPPEGENLRGEENAGQKAPSWLEIIPAYRDPYPLTAPVGLSKPSEHGLFDLGGNAGEWCADWYDASQKERVARGGSFNAGKRLLCQSDYRTHFAPETHASSSGFRVVLDEAEAR